MLWSLMKATSASEKSISLPPHFTVGRHESEMVIRVVQLHLVRALLTTGPSVPAYPKARYNPHPDLARTKR